MQYSIAEARNQLSSIVHEAERGQPVELTRRGELVAVILSANVYRRLTAGGTGLWNAIEAWREGFDVADLDIDPEVFNVRDPSPGRDFQW